MANLRSLREECSPRWWLKPRKSSLVFRAACVVLLCRPLLHASGAATITFSQDFPSSEPEKYSIAVQSDGHAHYECTAKISEDSDDRETYEVELNLSDATRGRIFELAEQAHYFSGRVDSGNRKLAFTGAKRLAYRDDQRNFTADYNFSSLAAVQQLTALFQNVAATLEFGRRLAHYHRYQKLALDEELKRMQEEARHGDLAELQAIKPVLQEIFNDPSVINVVRARAQQIMEMGDGAPAGHSGH